MHFGQSIAQSAFYYQHFDPIGNSSHGILETDNNYIVCGQVDSTSAYNDGYVMMMDKSGQVVWDTIYETVDNEIFYAVEDVKDGFIIGGLRIVQNRNQNLIIKFDYHGNKIWEKVIGDSMVAGGDNLLRDMLYDDGILLATSGFDAVSNSTNGELIKIDLGGNVVWRKNYGTDVLEERSDRVSKVERLVDGYLLTLRSLNAQWQEYRHLIKVDLNGNEIWKKDVTFYEPKSVDFASIIYFYDATIYKGNHTLGYFIKEDIPTYTTGHIIIEFDENGKEVDFREYNWGPAVAGGTIQTTGDNEIIITGMQDFDTVGAYFLENFAAKFDCNKNKLWEKHYGTKNAAEFHNNSILTTDGGIMILGRKFNWDIQALGYTTVLVKTDCSGNLDWNSESCISPTTKEPLMFPNPFNYYINIHLPNAPKQNKMDYEVYNINGQLIDRGTEYNSRITRLNTELYSNGIYIIRIFIDGAIYHTEKVVKYDN